MARGETRDETQLLVDRFAESVFAHRQFVTRELARWARGELDDDIMVTISNAQGVAAAIAEAEERGKAYALDDFEAALGARREAQAEAWAEGFCAGVDDSQRDALGSKTIRNPYAKDPT